MPSVDTRDIDKLVARLQAAGKELDQVGEVMQETAKFIVDKARPNMPRGESGAFRSSWKVKAKGKAGATITTDKAVPYAGPQEFGGFLKRFHSKKKTKYKPVSKSGYHIIPAWESNDAAVAEKAGEEARKRLEKALS